MHNKINKFYFGGQFNFRYEDCTYDVLSKDYRSLILKDVNKFMVRPKSGHYKLSNNSLYVGPFYFYDSSRKIPPQYEVVSTESKCIKSATHCVFVLSNASAPGTVTEIVHATLKHKNVIIFYETNNSDELVPNDLWYAINFAYQYNEKKCKLVRCHSYDSAVHYCLEYINSITEND